MVKAAEGAALGTDTKMEYEVISGVHDLLINKMLAVNMQANLEKVCGVSYTPEEIVFAKKIQISFLDKVPSFEAANLIMPLNIEKNRVQQMGEM